MGVNHQVNRGLPISSVITMLFLSSPYHQFSRLLMKGNLCSSVKRTFPFYGWEIRIIKASVSVNIFSDLQFFLSCRLVRIKFYETCNRRLKFKTFFVRRCRFYLDFQNNNRFHVMNNINMVSHMAHKRYKIQYVQTACMVSMEGNLRCCTQMTGN